MPTNQAIQFEDLNLLLKASSKQQVVELCEEAFKNRECTPIPNHTVQCVVDTLGIDTVDAVKVITALCSLIKNCLFNGCSGTEDVMVLFPEKFHKNLAELLARIIAEKYPSWKSNVVSSIVSLPKLAEFDWRLDLKMASGKIARMSEPTCILHLKIQDVNASDEDKLKCLNVELSKEKLDTMLSGLGRIRDQLSAVAKK